MLLHAANTALVFLVLQRMTRATWRCLIVAVLFGLHPLRVESVAWITERKDVLSVLFWLLALWAYVRYAEKSGVGHQSPVTSHQAPDPRAAGDELQAADGRSRGTDHRTRFYLLSLACFALGLMSKPMLVTLPCVLLLLDYWPLGRFESSRARRLVAEKAPFFALAAAASAVTFLVQIHGGAVVGDDKLPLAARAGNALISYWRYLGKIFWPTRLAVFYPHPGYWPTGQVLLAGGLILVISALLFVQRRRYPFLLVGWLWYCGTLVPAIGLVQSGEQAIADRFTYLPSLGVLILAIWGAHELSQRWRMPVVPLSVAGAAAIVLCFGVTRQQLGHWKDSETLFRHALQVTEHNHIAHNNLGSALDEKGQTDEAIRHYQEALRLKADNPTARNNLGIALARKGQIEEALRQYQEAIQLKPNFAEAHYSLANALIRTGRVDEAISEYQEAILLKPDYVDARNNLGFSLARKRRIDEAIREFQAALRLKPDHADARRNLDALLAMKTRSRQHPGGSTTP